MPSTGARLGAPAVDDVEKFEEPAAALGGPHRPVPPAGRATTLNRLLRDRFWLLVPLMALLATAIAAVHVRRVSLWVDEAYTVSVATRSLTDIWRMVHTIDVVHALFNTALHPWFAVAGVSEITVRLPSLLAVGIATAGVLVLARRLFGPSIAVAAGLIFAVLPRVTWMGIEGRSYATTVAVAVWWTVLFVGLLRRPRWYGYLGYAVVTAVAGSLNIFLVLLVGAHGLTLLLDRRLRWRRTFWTWLAAAAIGVLGAAPVLLTAAGQSAQIGPTRYGPLGYLRSVVVNQWFLGDTPTVYLAGGRVLDGGGSGVWKLAAVGLALLCWALIAYGLLSAGSVTARPAARDVPEPRVLLVAWLVVPTVILVGYALLGSTPIYNPRYLSYGAPAVAILTALGLHTLITRPAAVSRRRTVGAVAALAVISLAVPVYASQRTPTAKSGADWAGAAAFVAAQRTPGSEGVYFAPRSATATDSTSGTTSRTLATIYPDALAGMRDITLISTPAADANLTGRSLSLSAARARLQGLDEVIVVRRADYPNDQRASDERVLAGAGLTARAQWTGPLNTVEVYRRG